MAKGKKTCPECQNTVAAKTRECPECKYIFVKKEKTVEKETNNLEKKVDELTNMVSQLTNALVMQKKKLETIEQSKSNISNAKEYLDEIEKRKHAARAPAVVKPVSETPALKEHKKLVDFFRRNEGACPNKDVAKDINYGILYKRNAFLREIIKNNAGLRAIADKENFQY